MSIRARQILVVAVIAAAMLWPVVGDRVQAFATPDRDGCAHSSDLPSSSNRDEARAAIVCLVNKRRIDASLPPLVDDPALQTAAQGHAEDMGRRRFYAHENPDGAEPDQRIRRAGFAGSTTGENIHWGVGLDASPARIVDDSMDSPGHRENILRPSFTRVGTGVGHDAPEPLTEGPAGVYVQNFGG